MRLAQETLALLNSVKLSSGLKVQVNKECFVISEALFQPHLVDEDSVGLPELVFDVIQSADLTIRSILRRHLVLSGGTSMLPGLGSRLYQEMKQLIIERTFKGNNHRLEDLDISIEDHHPLRRYSTFLGAAKLADQKKDRESFWTTVARYNEEGYDRVAHRLAVHAI